MRPRGLLLVLVAAISIAGSSAWAANLAITSQTFGADNRSAPSFYPRSLATANCVTGSADCLLGTPARTPNNYDTVTVVFSKTLKQGTLCSAWDDGLTSGRSTTVTATISNNVPPTGNDTLSITASSVTCTGGMKFGTIDLGHPGYVSANINYTNTSFELTGFEQPQIRLKLAGGSTGSTVASGAGTAANYSCDVALRDAWGAVCAPSKSRTTATEHF